MAHIYELFSRDNRKFLEFFNSETDTVAFQPQHQWPSAKT